MPGSRESHLFTTAGVLRGALEINPRFGCSTSPPRLDYNHIGIWVGLISSFEAPEELMTSADHTRTCLRMFRLLSEILGIQNSCESVGF